MSDTAAPPADTGTPPPAAGSFLAGQADPAPPSSPPGNETASTAFLFGQHVNDDGSFKEGWTNALAEKFPRLANTAMKYKTEADFLQGMDHTLGLIGKKQAAVSYPGKDATPEDIAAFRQSAGVPTTPAEYQLKPEALPPGVQWDDAAAGKFAELLHAHHIPAEAAKAMVAAHMEMVTAQGQQAMQTSQAKLTEMVQQTAAEFQKEWGAQYHDRLDANRDFVTARLGEEALADPSIAYALSHPAIVRMIDEARRATREMPLPGAQHSAASGSESPQQQAIAIMKANPGWRQDPELSRRVNDLYAQQAAHNKRRAG